MEPIKSWVDLDSTGHGHSVLGGHPYVSTGLGSLVFAHLRPQPAVELRSLGCFISFPPPLLLKVLTSELQDVSERTEVSGLPGVCTLGQKSTKCLIAAIYSE